MSGILAIHQQHVMRAPVNPLDKSTLVSIYPLLISQKNVTITPGVFEIPPGSLEKPSLLVVGSSSWFREVDENQPLLEIPVSSIVVAESVVRDYTIGMLEVDMETRKPGLFFVPGAKSVQEIKRDHEKELTIAARKQKTWFEALVARADSLWARTMGNPLSIDDKMRIAAIELGMKDKEWIKNMIRPTNLINCPACTAMINSIAMVCPSCRVVIKPEEFAKMGMKFAG